MRSELAMNVRKLVNRSTSVVATSVQYMASVEIADGGADNNSLDVLSMSALGVIRAINLIPSGGDAAIATAASTWGFPDGGWKHPSATDIDAAFGELMSTDTFSLRSAPAITARLSTIIVLAMYAAIKPTASEQGAAAAATAVPANKKKGKGLSHAEWHTPKTLNARVPHTIVRAMQMFGASHGECFGNITVPAAAPNRSSMSLSNLVAIIDKVRWVSGTLLRVSRVGIPALVRLTTARHDNLTLPIYPFLRLLRAINKSKNCASNAPRCTRRCHLLYPRVAMTSRLQRGGG